MAEIALNPKDELRGLPDYTAGRSTAIVQAELGLEAVVALGSNEVFDGALPSAAKVIAEKSCDAHRYPEVRSTSLISAIAKFHGIDRSRVAVGPGSAGLMWQFSEAFLDSSSTVVAPAPSFEGYPLIAAIAGSAYVPVPLVKQQVDVAAMIEATTNDVDVVFIAEPNNPTGTAIGGPGLRRLIDHTRNRCFLIIDEAYVEFNNHPDAVDAIAMAEAEPHVLVLRTFSKAYGLAGLRVGYAVGEAEICTYLSRVAPPFSVNALAQEAALASLAAGDELADRVAAVTSERSRVIRVLHQQVLQQPALSRHRLTVVDSFANFVFIETSDPEPLAKSLEQRGVITRPVANAGLRVTIGSADDNNTFLKAMAEILSNPPATGNANLGAKGDAR